MKTSNMNESIVGAKSPLTVESLNTSDGVGPESDTESDDIAVMSTIMSASCRTSNGPSDVTTSNHVANVGLVAGKDIGGHRLVAGHSNEKAACVVSLEAVGNTVASGGADVKVAGHPQDGCQGLQMANDAFRKSHGHANEPHGIDIVFAVSGGEETISLAEVVAGLKQIRYEVSRITDHPGCDEWASRLRLFLDADEHQNKTLRKICEAVYTGRSMIQLTLLC